MLQAQYRRILSCRCTGGTPSPRGGRTVTLLDNRSHAVNNGVSAASSVVRHMRSRSCLGGNAASSAAGNGGGGGLGLGGSAAMRARVASAHSRGRHGGNNSGAASAKDGGAAQELEMPLTRGGSSGALNGKGLMR